jgi:hypothetical protein
MIFLACSTSVAETIKVAVLDSGLNTGFNIKVCAGERVSFVDKNTKDAHGHGTNVSYLINRGLNNADYCQSIYKVWNGSKDNGNSFVAALKVLTKRSDIKVVNLSIAGVGYNPVEAKIITTLLDQGKILVVASGNNGQNLTNNCNIYPACYDERIIVVANGFRGRPYARSNYGAQVDYYIDGRKKGPPGIKLTGSSQSTAIVTNQLLHVLINK